MILTDKLEIIKRLNVGNKTFNADLRCYCTWKIGGKADLLVEPTTEEQLLLLLKVINEYDIPFIIIGNGSNLLFNDAGIRGVVVRLGEKFNAIDIVDDIVKVQAGAWVPCLARKTAQAGLSGLEHIIGIPATIGGLVVMNGGSKRQSISEVVQEVELINLAGEKLIFNNENCDFGYRKSIFQKNGFVITSVKLKLQQLKDNIRGTLLGILQERRKKFPLHAPSCGSVFKSTPQLYEQYGPPGKIIEDLGLKGFMIGEAVVSKQHANFIINNGQATAEDILQLIGYIKVKAVETLGAYLETEVLFAKEDCSITHI
jgi:UDP-N-acetylmuramate dehydrogenase